MLERGGVLAVTNSCADEAAQRSFAEQLIGPAVEEVAGPLALLVRSPPHLAAAEPAELRRLRQALRRCATTLRSAPPLAQLSAEDCQLLPEASSSSM